MEFEHKIADLLHSNDSTMDAVVHLVTSEHERRLGAERELADVRNELDSTRAVLKVATATMRIAAARIDVLMAERNEARVIAEVNADTAEELLNDACDACPDFAACIGL